MVFLITLPLNYSFQEMRFRDDLTRGLSLLEQEQPELYGDTLARSVQARIRGDRAEVSFDVIAPENLIPEIDVEYTQEFLSKVTRFPIDLKMRLIPIRIIQVEARSPVIPSEDIILPDDS